MLDEILFGREKHIGRRLIVYIIGFSSLITLLISAIQLGLEYRELRDDMESTLDGVRLHVPSVTRSVWDFDEQKIQLTLDALAQLPNIARVSIATNDEGKHWSAGKPGGSNAETHHYQLRQTVAGREKEIGTLEVVADVDAIYRQVAGLALAIVLGNAIKTFLVALFMVALFRRLVSGRLEALAGKVRQRLAAVSPSPGIAAPLAPPGELDELDAVDWVLERTTGDLAAAVAGMRELNAALAQQVAEKDAALRQREAAEKKIKFIAFHDSLTGLPNQQLAVDRFGQAVAYADREHSKVGLLFIDLDNFKTVNDSLGHAVGDGLIREVAARLRDCVRDTDTISRRGGDEFLIILPDLPEPDATAPILVKLMERLIEPMTIAGHELQTTASVGVAIYPDDGRDLDTLMKKAETAMYRAKDAGRNTYRFFDARMNVEAIEQLRLRNGLRRALERGEFVLHYQPQIDLATDNLVGVEALIRWNHPELGMILPDRFIPIAEESGLIVPISEWVLREACRQAASWAKAGMAGVVVAVNISGVHFRRGDLEQSVSAALEGSGLDAAMLELELTESILISHSEGVLETVGRLKQLGMKLSIDDFGTGYSSLSYLKRFQVDKLKIDQSFVHDLADDPEDAAIVRAIIQMAGSLGLRTIAEGVEHSAVLAMLRDFGCDEGQGFLFARPMPADELPNFRYRSASRPPPIGLVPSGPAAAKTADGVGDEDSRTSGGGTAA
jgi:diguanylate cyclase (GGDEF)-like protein